MTCIASDRDCVVEFVIEEYRRLQSRDPGHELLRYISEADDGFSYCSGNWQDFLAHFSPRQDAPVTAILGRYYIALRDAVDEIEGIDRKPKEPETPNQPTGSQRERIFKQDFTDTQEDNEEIPF